MKKKLGDIRLEGIVRICNMHDMCSHGCPLSSICDLNLIDLSKMSTYLEKEVDVDD